MINDYIKTGLRFLKSNKLFSAINILGLTIGLVSFILITSWIRNEISFDKFHKNASTLYRLISDNSTASPKPLAPVLESQFPEIIHATRFQLWSGCELEKDKNIFKTNASRIDDNFFDIFSFKFIEGYPQMALVKPSSIVVTQKLATLVFGDNNAMGQSINLLEGNQVVKYNITGIIENIPSNSHIQSDCFISNEFASIQNRDDLGVWSDWGTATYIQVQNNINTDELSKKISAYTLQFTDYEVGQLQPIKKIHLNPVNRDYAASCNKKLLYILSSIALIIFCVAGINYLNLTKVSCHNRFKEVGLKKVLGANRAVFIKQTLTETLFISAIIISLTIGSILILTPALNNLLGRNILSTDLKLPIIVLSSAGVLLIGITIWISQSSYSKLGNSTNLVNPKQQLIKQKTFIKGYLTSFQFALLIITIISAVVIKKQILYVQNMSLGFEKDNLVYFQIKNNSTGKIDLLKNELLKNPNISNATSGHLLSSSNGQSTNSMDWEGNTDKNTLYADVHRVDYDFQETYKTKIIKGRFFTKEMGTDKTSAFVLNSTAIKAFGIESPIGKSFSLWGIPGTIIGVIDDYNYDTAHNSISPVILWMNTIKNFDGFSSITLRIKPNDIQSTLKFAENTIEQFSNGYKTEYHFLNAELNEAYKSEQNLSAVLNIATLIAVLISCIGLFALISFSVSKRVKEIGVRKVNGAKVSEILFMLNKGFIKWIVIAFIIATPFAWFTMNLWLENFAYKTNLSWWIFVIAGLIALGIAMVTVCWQSWRAAARNPVEALRYE